ncbi:MAG: hypothetical protein ACI9G1_001463 [Pirellulaceae bacterium]|jgi:hypothetical protein
MIVCWITLVARLLIDGYNAWATAFFVVLSAGGNDGSEALFIGRILKIGVNVSR